MTAPAPLPPTDGRLTENIVHFARALRAAGIRVGTAQIETAIKATQAAGFGDKIDFYHILHATLITRHEDLDVFQQIFAMFWRDPEFLDQMIHMLSPTLRADTKNDAPKPGARRAADALAGQQPNVADPPPKQVLEVDARLSISATDVFRSRDFEQMSAAELRQAMQIVQHLDFGSRPVPTRRSAAAPRGQRLDIGATLRSALRRGGDIEYLARRAPLTRPPNLVALCDISGSMSVYSRVLLMFLHAIARQQTRNWNQLHGFAFGTRLTNITRALHEKDPDRALGAVGHAATDWQGGTRIGDALGRFNTDWSRRVLGQGAVVLLISDGLERGDAAELAHEAERLHLSCRELIWLNPLLRWEGFAPKAAGIRALMPHVDQFLPCHSLDSLGDLATALSAQAHRRRR